MPNSSTVRISKKAKETLHELSSKSGDPMLYVLDRAIENYRRRIFLEEVNRAYGRLRSDEKASREFDSEITAWDTTLMDGLEPSEKWTQGSESNKKQKRSRKK